MTGTSVCHSVNLLSLRQLTGTGRLKIANPNKEISFGKFIKKYNVRGQTNLSCSHLLRTHQHNLFTDRPFNNTKELQRLFLRWGLSSNLASQGHIIWNALGATALWYILFSRISLSESFLSPTNQGVWVGTGPESWHTNTERSLLCFFCTFTSSEGKKVNMTNCTIDLTGHHAACLTNTI